MGLAVVLWTIQMTIKISKTFLRYIEVKLAFKEENDGRINA